MSVHIFALQECCTVRENDNGLTQFHTCLYQPVPTNMKTTALLLTLGSATAFAPSQQSQSTTALGAYSDFKNEIGVVPPVSLIMEDNRFGLPRR